MRKEIDSCRTDVACQELSLAGNIRALLRERSNQMKNEKNKSEISD
ncbi:hypothetical protein H6F43_07975 [Leptolyngbya sp. FACHB-36]|nr:hypothetical protein [Leptolyngbya sp. FACHB-36]MBD2020124.1 hypothetical protein [Leptolyngbya sp. FACHB-36]